MITAPHTSTPAPTEAASAAPAPVSRARVDLAAPLLLASALVIAALIIVQLGRGGQKLGTPDAALASMPLTLAMNAGRSDTVAQLGDYSMLSFDAGSDDVIAVLDSRGEQLFVYRIENQREFKLLERESLPDIFIKSKTGRK